MRELLLATAATIGLTISPAMGQGATDQDLRVGYCLGAMHGADTSNLDAAKLVEDNTLHFQRYLFARGYLSNPTFDRSIGILMAAQQGEYDIQQSRSDPSVAAQMNRFGTSLNSCQNKCFDRYPWSPGSDQKFDQFRTCSDSCWNLLPDAAKRFMACFDLAKQLPF